LKIFAWRAPSFVAPATGEFDMKAITLGGVAVLCACVSVACSPGAREGHDNKLVGVWEQEDGDAKGSTVEFTGDGKLKVVDFTKGQKIETIDGTYTLDGDTLKIALIHGEEEEKKDSVKITKLTDQELVTEDEKGKVDHFKRVH
jgi:uncharacterized protein (TIGR03066 family)